MLLGAVVDVPFEPASLGVLGLDDAAARRSQLLRSDRELLDAGRELRPEARSLQHMAGLGGEAVEQPSLDRGQRLVRALLDAERTERLAREAYEERALSVRSRVGAPGDVGPSAAPSGQVAARTGASPTSSQTWAQAAPVPSASTRAIVAGTSSSCDRVTEAENPLRTS